ncbi:MAG: mechanosensitive ion channel [Gammaproteobacteria bacterium]|nr:mechanosensitive ion channel [Gammaproteobacteria bacterium]
MEKLYHLFEKLQSQAAVVFTQSETYIQIVIISAIYAAAYIVANHIRRYFSVINEKLAVDDHPIQKLLSKLGNLIFSLTAILLLRIAAELSQTTLSHDWIVQTALIVAVLLLFNSVVDDLVENKIVARIIKWIGTPILFLHMIGALTSLIQILQSISISVGNIDLSLYGILRVAIFGTLLFWLGRISNSTGKDIIRRQQQLDFRTREVASKLLEVVIFVTVSLLLLQIMGINLTALAVFGGALGVGLGFGLQAIASNFISGIIILLDRSVSIDDYIELEDGRTGFVRELNMRSTTLETYDGKDIMVPNEKFIVESFTNWTHKNKLQRYRVDFPVAYHSDIRKLVAIIKEVVATHPQVLSGDDLSIEERPDCEIDGFSDSGINMFVEFWMEGVDDGKNRVGGDLLLMILETLQQHGYQIPFPQREVRILNPQ